MTTPINEEDSRPMFTASVDATLLAKRLAKCAVGEQIGYGELSAIIKRDVTGDDRHLLETARRIVQREHKIVFDVVRTVGLVRLSDAEIAEVWRRDVASIGRKARAGARRTACADYEKLQPEKQRAFNTAISVFGFIRHILKPKSVQQIEDATSKEQKRFDAKETLALFAK